MKKFTFLTFLFLIIAMVSTSQTLNNPKDGDGYYIVKWNCTTSAFDTANYIESDETFTFAVDVTGTPWEEWLKGTPTAAGATRALAINKWTNFGNVSGGTNRLKQIGDNIYAATWNLVQMATDMNVTAATGIDSIVYVYGQVFGFEFTSENPGAGWWMWPAEIPAATQIDPGAPSGAIFRTLPYTGTKSSAELWSDDYEGGLFFSNNTPEKGYTLPCMVTTGIKDISKSDAPVIGHEYYNINGAKISRIPQNGIYIHKKIKADGTFEVTKEIKFIR
jgi:hypothetical protein